MASLIFFICFLLLYTVDLWPLLQALSVYISGLLLAFKLETYILTPTELKENSVF